MKTQSNVLIKPAIDREGIVLSTAASEGVTLSFNRDAKVSVRLSLKEANNFTLLGFSLYTSLHLKIHWSHVSTINEYSCTQSSPTLTQDQVVKSLRHISLLCENMRNLIITAAAYRWRVSPGACYLEDGEVLNQDCFDYISYEELIDDILMLWIN